jgi:hypothetical protein
LEISLLVVCRMWLGYSMEIKGNASMGLFC